MFDVAIRNSSEAPSPGKTSLRALIRSTFEGEAAKIRYASAHLTGDANNDSDASEVLCRFKLVLIAEAPIRVVASSHIPAVAVTRAIQRAQSVLSGRRMNRRNNRPVRDHLAA